MRINKLLVTVAFSMLFISGVVVAASDSDNKLTAAQFKKILAKAIPMAEQGDAIAQCGGDKEKQKSIYVELRTKELSKG